MAKREVVLSHSKKDGKNIPRNLECSILCPIFVTDKRGNIPTTSTTKHNIMATSTTLLITANNYTISEMFYVCSIEDIYHKDGVEITFGLNIVDAPASYKGVVCVEDVNRELLYHFDTDLDELCDSVDAGECSLEEAKQMLMESIGDSIDIDNIISLKGL